MKMKANDVMQLIKEKKVKAVDVRFVDLPGLWQHFTVSAREFSADAFEEGLGFDGSSIRGFQAIQESDMLLMPDPTTAFLDPFATVPTVVPVFVKSEWPTSFAKPKSTILTGPSLGSIRFAGLMSR